MNQPRRLVLIGAALVALVDAEFAVNASGCDGISTQTTSAAKTPHGIALSIKLRDGSLLKGSSSVKHLTLQSEFLAALAIPLDKIHSISFPKDAPQVLVTLQNGDRVQGRLADATLSLKTSFGPVTLAMSLISEIQVQAGGVARPVRWERLFLSSDDEESTITLRGQTARTRETFRGPMIFECTVRLEKKITDGCIGFRLVPQKTDGGEPAQDALLAIVLGDSQRDGSGGHVSLERPGMPAYRLTRREFLLTANQDYRLGLELRDGRLRVRFNNEVSDVANVPLPADEFRIYVKGWKPDNTWIVRDATVRLPEP